jgi:hypothetical protein
LDAPNKPSPKQACIGQAKQDYQNKVAQLKNGLGGDLVKGAIVGVALSPVKGCVAVGAVFSVAGPEGFVAGCVVGGLAGMNPASLAISALQGASGAALWDTGMLLYDRYQYNSQVANCSNLPD